MDNTILSALEDKFSSFSKGQKRIARYILADLSKAAFLTAGVLGKETEVSESTVVRFAVELGYDGFPQMQKALQEALVNRFTSGAEHTERSSKLPTEADFSVAVQMISSARRIYLIGFEAEYALAAYMGHHLEKRFEDVHILSADSVKLRYAGAADIAVIFSFSPDHKKVAEIAAACRNAGVKVIGITTDERSPICPSCDLALFARAEKTTYGYSLSEAMVLTESLLCSLLSKEEENANEI